MNTSPPKPTKSPSPLTRTPTNPSSRPLPQSTEIADTIVKTLYQHFPSTTSDYVEARKHLKSALQYTLKTYYADFKVTLYAYPKSAITSTTEFVFLGAYGDNYVIPWQMAYAYGFLMVKLEQGGISNPITYVGASVFL